MKRLLTILTVIALMGVLVAAPAGATPRDEYDEHKVVVCHQTGNGKFIAITIDVAGAANGHEGHAGDRLLSSVYTGPTDGMTKKVLSQACLGVVNPG